MFNFIHEKVKLPVQYLGNTFVFKKCFMSVATQFFRQKKCFVKVEATIKKKKN